MNCFDRAIYHVFGLTVLYTRGAVGGRKEMDRVVYACARNLWRKGGLEEENKKGMRRLDKLDRQESINLSFPLPSP